MTPKHSEHLAYILDRTQALLSAKYEKGAKEYGNHLRDDYTTSQLLDNAIEEAIDMVVYLLTMKQKIEEEDELSTL